MSHLKEFPGVGSALIPLVATPTPITLFRFSAVTWNPHRIHYDAAYAAREGYPNVLVQSHLHGAFITECVLGWNAGRWRLKAISWSNRFAATAGDTLTVTGFIDRGDASGFECSLSETNQDGVLCATGRATLIPLTEGE